MSTLLEFLRAILIALGLHKVKQAGRDEAEKESAEDELQATDDARAARESLDNPDVRDSLREHRKKRER